MAFGNHQHLFVIEYGFKFQAGFEYWIGRHKQINLITQKCTETAKLEFLFHVHIDIGPGTQVR